MYSGWWGDGGVGGSHSPLLLSLPLGEEMGAVAPASWGPVRDFPCDEPNPAPGPQEAGCAWPLAAS